MRPDYKILMILFLLFSASRGFGQAKNDRQKIQDLFVKSQAVYDNSTVFKLATNYKLFTSYTSAIVSENYDGIIIRNKKDFYSKVATTEFIKLNGNYIKIDHSSKLIQYSYEKEPVAVNDIYNLNKLMSNFKVFELTSNKDYWICTMTGPEVTFIPYGKAVVYIKKTDFTILKQVLFLLTKNNYKDKKGKSSTDFPRMEISFSQFVTKDIDLGSKFKLETYLKEKNKKYFPSALYKDYKIID